MGLQEVESRAPTDRGHTSEHSKILPEGRGQRVKKPKRKKLAALPTHYAPNAPTPPPSSPPPLEYRSSSPAIQILSDTSELNEKNAPQPKQSTKRPATGSGGSPPKKATRNDLELNLCPIFSRSFCLAVRSFGQSIRACFIVSLAPHCKRECTDRKSMHPFLKQIRQNKSFPFNVRKIINS